MVDLSRDKQSSVATTDDVKRNAGEDFRSRFSPDKHQFQNAALDGVEELVSKYKDIVEN